MVTSQTPSTQAALSHGALGSSSHVIGSPATGSGQNIESVEGSASLLLPADVAASGFYGKFTIFTALSNLSSS